MLTSIENYFERLVIECIKQCLNDSLKTKDLDYLDDLACVALNLLPPKYVRHSVDLASHLDDAEHESLLRQATDAVNQAISIIERRHTRRD